jgi:hypothetical protein
MPDLGEESRGGPADTLGRRVGRNQVGVLRFDRNQLGDERIEIGVGDLRLVVDEVPLCVVVDQTAKLDGANLGRRISGRRRHEEQDTGRV